MTDQYVPVELRRRVAERARGYCEYCRCPAAYSPQSFAVEHIWPRVAGGLTVADNLAFACQGCNGHKATRLTAFDSVSGTAVSLFNPRQQVWREHFCWGEGSTEVLGLTPIGRATVVALQLNRLGLVNLRRVLHANGFHPPIEADEITEKKTTSD